MQSAVHSEGVASSVKPPAASFALEAVRRDFPTLERLIHGQPLIYLDSGASALKPQVVIERMTRFYRDDFANIHRGAHTLSAQATADYEAARAEVASFIGAADSDEIVFVRGTTEAVNLVAASYGPQVLGAGDRVVVTELEHHSNFLPWQRLCAERGAELVVAPIDDEGELDMARTAELIDQRTKIVAVAHVSNVLGTVLPIAELARLAHGVGAVLFVDGAQGVVHLPVDVRALGCDFYAFSGHKLYGPTGVGTLWGRAELLAAMPPYQMGGGMIDTVALGGSTYLDAPLRFEAGTPHIAGALGLASAIGYLRGLGMEAVAAHEGELTTYALEALGQLKGLRILGPRRGRSGVLSFVLEGVHPADIGAILDRQGIAVRIGHHCAQPLMRRFAVSATTRASLGLYNSPADVDALVVGLRKVLDLFA